MNLEKNPTLDDLRSLIAAADDRAGHHVLWVDDHADVHLTRLNGYPIPKCPNLGQSVKLQVETFPCRYEYTGPTSAQDDEYLGLLLTALRKEWLAPKGPFPYLELERVFHPEDFDDNGVMKSWGRKKELAGDFELGINLPYHA